MYALAGVLFVACLGLTGMAPRAEAQDAQQRQAAAQAFDRGRTAYLNEDYATAARWFEMANDLAPAAGALMQAIVAHQRAGNELRAASLSLRLIARFPDEAAMVGRAQAVIDELGPKFFRIDVECDAECAVEVDGRLASHTSLYLSPGDEHTVGATFDTGTEQETVQGAAGETRALTFTAPEGPPVSEVEGPGSEQTPQPNPLASPVHEEELDEDDDGISPAYFITSLVLTAGAGGLLIWSGMDTLNANDEYIETADEWRASGDPAVLARAETMLDDGESKELRTNVLIGATAGLATLTLALAIFTDWAGGDEDGEASTEVSARLRPQISLGGPKNRAGGLVLEGQF